MILAVAVLLQLSNHDKEDPENAFRTISGEASLTSKGLARLLSV